MLTACPPIAAATSREQRPLLVEGRDYYLERGRFVLTAAYLERQESCCGNGCRHCPYKKNVTSSMS